MLKTMLRACVVPSLLLALSTLAIAADEVVYGPVDYTIDASGRYYGYPYQYIGCVSGNGDPRYHYQVPCLVKITNVTPERFIYSGSIAINGRHFDIRRVLSPHGYYDPYYSYAYLRVCPPTYTSPYVNPIFVQLYGQPGATLSIEIIKKDTTLYPQVTLSAEPVAVTAGEPVTLTWHSTNADACTISPRVPGFLPPQGSVVVTPSETTTYTVTAYSFRSYDRAQTEVIAKVPVPTDVDLGRQPDEQLNGAGLLGDTVRILNGNVVETRADLRLPSPHRTGLAFEAFYNSQSTSSGILGPGWSHTYSVSLDRAFTHAGGTYLKIVAADGRGVYFKYAGYDASLGASVYKGRFYERSHVTYIDAFYVWHRLDGSTYGFDSNGRLKWIEDRAGNRMEVTYDAVGNPARVDDIASGRFLAFNYNPEGRLASISGPQTAAVPDGIWVRYGYDSVSNPVSVAYADGSEITYRYADPGDSHNLTQKGNAVGHLLKTWSYDDQDRCTHTFSVEGNGVSINYIDGQTVAITDAYAIVRTYTLSEIGGRLRVTAMNGIGGAPYASANLIRWQYDDDLNLSEVETPGGSIYRFMDFDPRGNPATVIEAAGSADERITTLTYHPNMNVPLSRSIASVLSEGHKTTVWDYDNDSNETANENPTGLLSRIIEKGYTRDAAGNIVPYEYITRLTHNSSGQIIAVDGPRTEVEDITLLTYDAATGNLLSTDRPLIGAVTIDGYDAAGRPLRLIDVNGQARQFIYDGFGRIKSVAFEADGSSRFVDYNLAGLPEVMTDEDGVARFFEYETEYGRLLRMLDLEGNTIQHRYDSQGNLVARSKHDPAGAMVQIKQWDYHGPDIPGKLWKEIQSNGSFREYSYDADGRVIRISDFEQNITRYTYDRLGRLSTIVQPEEVRTAYAYDYHGNLRSVTDANGNQTLFEYDDMGRALSAISPDSGTTTTVYDAAGNVIQQTDGNGVVINYSYDALNRLIHASYPDANQNVTYTYDEGPNGMGQRSGIIDPVEQTAFQYDSRGRLTGKTTTATTGTFVMQRTYSPAGRLLSLTYPSGRRLNFNRYENGKIEGVYTTFDSVTLPLISGMEYNPFGMPAKMDTGYNSTVDNRSGDCDCLEVINPGQPTEQQYTYDDNRNLLSISAPNLPWYNQSFSYDPLGRLTQAAGLYGTIDYTYDTVGNRLSRSTDGDMETYRYVSDTNRLSDIETPEGVTVYEHDAAGNVIRAGDWTYLYNQHNRMIEVQKNGKTYQQYGYNALGQRVYKALPPFSEQYIHFHYDFDGNIIAESNAAGEFASEYLYFAGSRLAKVDVAANTLYYYVNNYLGTPFAMTDATGTIVWEASYKPFGEALINDNSEIQNNFRFPGQYHDTESGLHYNYHRYYDPKTGRYLRPDPIGLAGGINLYGYVFGDPVNKIDQFGLEVIGYDTIQGLLPNPPFPVNPNISTYEIVSTLVQVADLLPLQAIPSPVTVGAAVLFDVSGAIFSAYDIHYAYERGDISCDEYQLAIINWNLSNVSTIISYVPGVSGFGMGAELYFFEMNLALTTGSYNPFNGWW